MYFFEPEVPCQNGGAHTSLQITVHVDCNTAQATMFPAENVERADESWMRSRVQRLIKQLREIHPGKRVELVT